MNWPRKGCGAGLRTEHYQYVLEKHPAVDWFEVISENFMDSGGKPMSILEEVRKAYPIACHGVSLSIGTVDPLDRAYLERLKQLIRRIDPFIVSDHLCWTGVGGENLHDLLPLPFTEEALEHVVSRVQQVQDYLGRPILLENVSSYLTYEHSVIPEWEFLANVAQRSGCGILLDLNNVHVNAYNHQFDAMTYVEAMPVDKVGQIHLAGYTDMGKFYFDTHSAPVVDKVWKLYEAAMKRFGPVSTLIEWDEHVPPFERLLEEVERARNIHREFQHA